MIKSMQIPSTGVKAPIKRYAWEIPRHMQYIRKAVRQLGGNAR